MEIFDILLVSIFPTLLFIVYVSKYIRPITRSVAPLPTGKLGLPILGKSMDFVSNLHSSTPEWFIRDCIIRHASCAFKMSLLGGPMVVMYGAKGNKFVFANEGKLVRLWWPKTIHTVFPTTMAGSKAFHVKDLAYSFLKPDGLHKYVGIMDSMTQTHLDAKWHGQQEVMVYPMAEEYTFTLACRLFLSTKNADLIAKLTGPMTAFTSGISGLPINLPWTRFGRAVRASNVITTQLTTVIRKRRHELLLAVDKDLTVASHQDILSHMLLSTDENGKYMNDVEVAERIKGIIVAGQVTSGIVISVLFKYLGEDPELYRKVSNEMEVARNKADGEPLNWNDIMKMKYSWNAALEVMRLYPPTQVVLREVISDFTYFVYHVPKGWKLLVSIHSTHRDPEYFPDPEKFDPSRFEEGGPMSYTFLPFGGGPRICPSRNYARIEILAFLHNVVKRFKWENILRDKEIVLDPTPRPGKGLPVRLLPLHHH